MQSMLNWLSTPVSGSVEHHIAAWTAWHARLMVAAWTILLPAGMLIARFCKRHPLRRLRDTLDTKFWWRTHVCAQVIGAIAVGVGIAFAWGHLEAETRTARVHAFLGWIVVAIVALQLISGMLRGTKGGPSAAAMRGDHYDMTLRRLLFEWLHKSLGWIAVPISIAATAIGLVMVDAPRWMPIVIASWWLIYVISFFTLQRAGFCVDTYQSIWGADAAHPGNQRKPIGLGVRRKSIDL